MGKFFSKHSMFFKYFYSYLIILGLSVLGVYYIINSDLRKAFIDTYEHQLQSNINILSDSIENEFYTIMQIDYELANNIELINSRYSQSGYQKHLAQMELRKHLAGNTLIEDIIYINLTDYKIMNNYNKVVENNGVLTITNYNDFKVEIPYQDLMNNNQFNTLLKMETGDSSVLLYIPMQYSYNYISLFLINEQELISKLNTVLLPSTTNISLVDMNNYVMVSSNERDIEPLIMKNSTMVLSENESLYSLSCDFPSLRIVALSDNDIINNIITSTFTNAYTFILFIIILGCLCFIVFLCVTYVPLKRFSKRISTLHKAPSLTYTKRTDIDLNYIEQLFKNINSENDMLLHKIWNYRYAIQKSILSSIAMEQDDLSIDSSKIDALFAQDVANSFFIIYVTFEEAITTSLFTQILETFFSDQTTCIILDNKPSHLSYLVCCPSFELSKQDNLDKKLLSLMLQFDCKIYTSERSNSPMDIARLYESVLHDSDFLENTPPVSNDKEQAMLDDIISLYPYQVLDSIALHIEALDFNGAINTIYELFDIIVVEKYPIFFIRCTLLDTLTHIISCISNINVPFDHLSEDYYKILYLCRNSNYAEMKNEIQSSFITLLHKIQNKLNTPTLNIPMVIQYISEHFTESDFSIVQLGDYFHVTGAYISYWFKKNMNQNISDYLWNLRFDYSKELMLQQDLPMKDISIKIGYDNYSSFRRKFKECTGLSPSEYRAKMNVKSYAD